MRSYCLIAFCVIVLTKGGNQLGARDNADASINAEHGRAAREDTEDGGTHFNAIWEAYQRNVENFRNLQKSLSDSIMKKLNITVPEEKPLDEDKKPMVKEQEKSTDVPEEKPLDEEKKPMIKEQEKSTDAPEEKMLHEDKKSMVKEEEKTTDAPEEKMLHEDKKPMVKEEEKSTDGPEEKMLDEDMKIVDHEISYNVTEEEMLDEDKKLMDKENVTVTDEYTCDDEGRCLRIHYDNEYSWQDSKVVCETEGARLAVIGDEKMNNLTNSLYDRDMKGPWIGMSVDSMGNMTWITGKSINDNERRKWSSENSRAFEDGMSECGVFSSDKWGLDRCDASRPFICEKVQ